jgi:pre-rRNA-processing protein TSR1
MSKIARRNQGKQLRMHQHEKKDDESSIFQGKDGAPKHVAVIPLSLGVDVSRAIKQLNDSVQVTQQISDHDMTKVKVDRFRRNLLYMPAKYELITALDVCQLADWVVLVLSAEQQIGEEEDQFIRALEGQGITNVLCVIQGVTEAIPVPRRSKVITEAKSEMTRYLPNLDKLWTLDSPADCANVVRSLCTASSRGVRWRDQRSWMLIENLEWKEAHDDQDSSTVAVTGTVRGKALNPDRLVHIPGWGDFQIGQVTELPQRKTQNGQEDRMEDVVKRHVPSPDQDDLLTLAPEDEEMHLREATSTVVTDTHKGVLLDDHHYFSDDNSYMPPPPKRLPKGTSAYQAAWYLDNVSDSDSDIVDDENQDMDVTMEVEPEQVGPEDGAHPADPMDAMTEAGPSEYPESEMHIDRSANEEAEAIEEFRKSRKEAEEDLEFPDEIELNPNVLARERLAKYRGLKSLRTSEWNVDADTPYEPSDYQRLLKIADYKKSHNAVVRETLAGGVPAGTRVEVELSNVPTSLQKSGQPISMFSLLRHEHQSVVVNLNVTLSSALEEPVRSKEELLVQIGPRRLVINPVFSAAGSTPNDVHKFDRFLHPGRTAIASFLGPLTWGSVPVLVFKDAAGDSIDTETEVSTLVEATDAGRVASSGKSSQQLRLIGNATTIPPSSSRVIAKRVILTGHPYKIHKKLVTIRYMFFNREDVAWFSALPLWTKRGRQGFIKESLGTHGYFKATFDGKINPMDAVGVSLYKRVFPRPAKMWNVDREVGIMV